MDLELFVKVQERKERGAAIESFLIFPMAALHFAIMPWGIRANELVADAKLRGSIFKKCG